MKCNYCGNEIPQDVEVSFNLCGKSIRFCSEDCKTLWDINRKRKAAEGRAKKQAEKKAKAEALAEIKEEAVKVTTTETIELSKPLDPMEEAYHIVEGVKAEYGEQAQEVLIGVMLKLNNDSELAGRYSEVEIAYRKAAEIISGADDAVKAMLRRLL